MAELFLDDFLAEKGLKRHPKYGLTIPLFTADELVEWVASAMQATDEWKTGKREQVDSMLKAVANETFEPFTTTHRAQRITFQLHVILMRMLEVEANSKNAERQRIWAEYSLWFGDRGGEERGYFALSDRLEDGVDTLQFLVPRWFRPAFESKIAALMDTLALLAQFPRVQLTEPVYVDIISYYAQELPTLTTWIRPFDAPKDFVPEWISEILAEMWLALPRSRGSSPKPNLFEKKQMFFEAHEHYLKERVRFTNWYCTLKISAILCRRVIYQDPAYTDKPVYEITTNGFIIQYIE